LFGVTAKLIGGGAGRWLMNRALELAWARQVKRVWLHTRTLDHPAALSFYRRASFRPFRRRNRGRSTSRRYSAASCRKACADY
jgi:GNAT superfamily N-acetyltransferase